MGTCVDGDIIRVTAKLGYTTSNWAIQNVYHMEFTGTSTVDDDVHDAIATALDTAYVNILDHMPASTTFRKIETWNLTQDRPMIEDDWPTNTQGSGAGDVLPGQCAPLCLFNTAVARSQGRKFLPNPMEVDCAGNTLNAGTLSDIADWAADILLGASGVDFSLFFGNYNPALSRFARWISAEVSSIIRTQRRRVPGIGS